MLNHKKSYNNTSYLLVAFTVLFLTTSSGCSQKLTETPPSSTTTTTETSVMFATDLERALHDANIQQAEGYGKGEIVVEGHHILGTDIQGATTTVYTVSNWGWMAFENDIFTLVSGAYRVPTVIIFTKNTSGQYTLVSYKEPMGGSAYGNSLKKMFPSHYLKQALKADDYHEELFSQQKAQAKEYLNKIGRTTAPISLEHVSKQLPAISAEAANYLSDVLSKNEELGYFPNWIGTVEKIENGQRYVYETSEEKKSDSTTVITYTKKDDHQKIVTRYRYLVDHTRVKQL